MSAMPSAGRVKLWLAAILLSGGLAVPPAAAEVGCEEPVSMVCTDAQLRMLNDDLAAREKLIAEAPMHQAFRSELEAANTEWEASIDDCAAAANAGFCYRRRLEQRIAVLDLLKRLFAGPHLPRSAVKACTARGGEPASCYETLFAAADTVYAIAAHAFATSLAAVNIQTPTVPDGASEASSAEEAFRTWRTAECKTLSRSPMPERGVTGGLLACQIGLTWTELATLAELLGRRPHWSERILDYAPRFRACFDRGRDEDVDLRIVDVFAGDTGEIIRLMGSRGRYDCAAVATTVSSFLPAQSRSARPGEAEAIFVPVQGSRPPEAVLAAPGGRKADCYETQAVIAAEARLSGWIAVSHCD
ncbi:MAG: hypothetical protein AB7S92_06760 [Parvibaculaceae bacterium]